MASTKSVELTDKHAVARSNSMSEEARTKRNNFSGGFGTDRCVEQRVRCCCVVVVCFCL